MAEQELLNKMKQGDQRAFDSLFNSYYEKLVRVAFSLVSDLDVAEDMVQEVLSNYGKKE